MQIVILSLEPLDTRYTAQWLDHIPKLLYDTARRSDTSIEVINLLGDIETKNTTPGAFLNFGLTNIWKNNQMNKLFSMINSGDIRPGVKVLFPDAWHTGVIQLRYFADLCNFDCEIHSIYHAGSYDCWDMLGQAVTNKNWSYNFERSLYHASDYNWFATEYHLNMFKSVLGVDGTKAHISGFPFEYLKDIIKPGKKRNLILFPHRIAPEKQLHIFKQLAQKLPQFEWVVCQEKQLTKAEYHKLLGEAKIVFSANLQETLGISVAEICYAGGIPVVPDRLSYSEIYLSEFKYPSAWSDSYENFENSLELVCDFIIDKMENFDGYHNTVTNQIKVLDNYFSANILIKNLIN